MKQFLILFVLASFLWSCDSSVESERITEVTLDAKVTKAYGGPFPFVIHGEVQNNHGFPVFDVIVKVTTSSASNIVDVRPDALEPGKVGFFADTVRGEFPTLEATGKTSAP